MQRFWSLLPWRGLDPSRPRVCASPSMNSWLHIIPLIAMLALGACKPETPADLTFEVGTGEVMFEALEDYQEAPLVAGPQGGHHVWISFRATGLSSERVLMDLDMVPLDESEPPPRAEPVRVFTEVANGEQVFVGWPAQILEAGCYVGVPLSVRVEVTDTAGHVVSDERIIVPTSDETLECER